MIPAITDQNRKWWILVAMGACGGLIMLDETVVALALPTMRGDLDMSQVAAHWVISIYMLVFTGTAAASGKIGDVVGFKTLFLAGSALFGLASLAAGAADNGTFLIAIRALQGLGAAAIFPATVAMVMIVFPEDQRGMATGILAAVGTSFLAAGPVIGGFLTEMISWRWIFWINIPIVIAVSAIVFAAWGDKRPEGESSRFDYRGLTTLVVGLTALVFAIMQGGDWGWTEPVIIACLAGGIVLLGLFVHIEARQRAPLIDVELFRSASFSACNLVIVAGQFSKIAIVVFGALLLQQKLDMSPAVAGLALLVSVVGFPFLSGPLGRLADKLGARPLVLVGMTIATAGVFWLAFAVDRDSYVLLLPGLILWGLGMPGVYAPTLRAMANSVAKEKQGQVGGIGVTGRLLGGTIGMSLSSTLLLATGSFEIVFLASALVMLAALAFAAFAIAGEPAAHPTSAHPRFHFWSHS